MTHLNAIKSVCKKRAQRGSSIESIIVYLTHLINDTYSNAPAMIKAIETLIQEAKKQCVKKARSTRDTLSLIIHRRVIKEDQLKARANSMEEIMDITNEYKKIFNEDKAYGLHNAISALSKYYAIIELRAEGLID